MGKFFKTMNCKILTFSGVDGAGKTTVLKDIRNLLMGEYGLKVVELRQRPSVLPILSALKYGKKNAELKTQEVLPRSGTNTSKVSSYFRFLYYLSDYIFGQWFVYFKYTAKGYVVIYDRYYFDFLSDPKRANIVINKSFVRFCFSFVFKPEINIFLYAPSDVILKRKQELSHEAIEELTESYKKLFQHLPSKFDDQYVCIENINRKETLVEIKSILDTWL